MSEKKSLFNRDWKIVEYWKYYLIIPSVIIIIGLILLFIPKIGFNLGIDFEGGYSLEVKYGSALTEKNYDVKLSVIEDVVETLKDSSGKPYKLKISRAQMQGEAESASILIRFKAIGDEVYMQTVTADLKEALLDKLMESENPYVGNVMESSTITQTISTEQLFRALAAIYLCLLLMLAYITVRFDFLSGLTIMLALLHDSLIMIVFMVFSRIEVNSTFIAAIVTLMGYSINNSVVIFDKIRENLKNGQNEGLSSARIANISIKQTFWRTFNSSLTTLFTIVVLVIIGVPAIREFALPIIVGLIAGTFSSMCIAPSIWSLIRSKKEKRTFSKIVQSTAENN